MLQDEVAVITGGGKGIGFAIAERFVAEGAKVVLADIDEAALDEARAALAKAFGGDRVRAARCDVTSETSVREAFDAAACEFGGLDMGINKFDAQMSYTMF